MATVSLAIAGGVIHFAGFVNLVDLVKDNPYKLLYGSLAYVLIGISWAFAKWVLFVIEKKNESIENIKKYTHASKEPPQVGEYKEDIARWFFYWPFSMVETVARDFTKKLFNFVYDAIKNSFQRMANHIYSDINKDV